MSTTTPVIALDHPAALDVARVGRKAADLAAARAAGLPVAPGVVLTTEWSTDDRATAAQVWRITSHDGRRPLVVRSSAVREPSERTMELVQRRRPLEHGAVEPTTIAGDLDAMLAAIADVRAHEATTPVLLQPHVAGTWRGVLFADTVAQRRASTSLTVARRADHTLDWVAQLDQHGRVRDVMSATAGGGPPTVVLQRLSRLADGVAARFDAPHDLEWVADDDGRLQLLRIDPVVHLRAATGPARPLTIAPRRARRRRTATVAPAFVDSRSIGDSAA